MNSIRAKKIGKAYWDAEKELWAIQGSSEKFCMNERLVESRPEYKELRSKYKKIAQARRPGRNKPELRDAYFEKRDQSGYQLEKLVEKICEEIRLESFGSPVMLRKHHDFEHNSDWRYCLYRGVVYRFERPGLTGDEMLAGIEALEGGKPASEKEIEKP